MEKTKEEKTYTIVETIMTTTEIETSVLAESEDKAIEYVQENTRSTYGTPLKVISRIITTKIKS